MRNKTLKIYIGIIIIIGICIVYKIYSKPISYIDYNGVNISSLKVVQMHMKSQDEVIKYIQKYITIQMKYDNRRYRPTIEDYKIMEEEVAAKITKENWKNFKGEITVYGKEYYFKNN